MADLATNLPNPGRNFRDRYLDLLELVLTRTGYGEADNSGRHWPKEAETMIGLKRLRNLRALYAELETDGIAGDLCETGVWRGGACIYMRALAEGSERKVFACDSFCGLPAPVRPDDIDLSGEPFLAVTLEEVQENFHRYDWLDERVRFVRGWFSESLAKAPIEKLALLRLDGDMYDSTMDALEALYPKLEPGGFLVVDDYGAIPQCRAAVIAYRSEHGIRAAICPIDWTGVFWRKPLQ